MRSARALALSSILAAAGCGDEAVPTPAPRPSGPSAYQGTLSAELRGSADVTFTLRAAADIDVQVTLRDIDTGGLFDPATPLSASGKRQPFPETDSELYTATFPAVAGSAGGACGAEPVTLALALHRRAPNLRFGGSLTAYCGARANGVPARIFRLTGTLTAS